MVGTSKQHVGMSVGRNGSIDLFRLVVSMAIVMIHFGTGVRIYSPIYNTLGRMGVPFFFLVTGYFYFSKVTDHKVEEKFNWRYYAKFMVKTFKIWLFWSILFIPRIFLVKQDIPITPFIVLRSLYGLSVTCGPLWYLIAAVEALALVHLTFQKLGKKWLIGLLLVTWVLCLLGSSYFGLLASWQSVQILFQLVAPETSIFSAYFWFGVALLFVLYKKHLSKFSALKSFVACTVLWALEIVIIKHFDLINGTDMYVMLVPESVLFLNLLFTYPMGITKRVDKILCDYSLYIYILQMFAGDLVNWLARIADISHPENSLFYFWIVLVLDIILASVVIGLKSYFKVGFNQTFRVLHRMR